MNKAFFFTVALLAVLGSAYAQDKAAKPQAAKEEQAAQPITTKTFTDFQIQMQFDYPSTWVMVADPKQKKPNWFDQLIGKKSRPKVAPGKQAIGENLFYLPATNNRTANLEVYGALWAQTPDLWETNQVDINKALKREVVKQWREEILGVPLLLTKLAYEDPAGGTQNALVGLIYSRTPYKMLFRLTSNDTDFDAAETEFRQVLQSLRTTHGALPVAEDPNHPLDASSYNNAVNKPPKVLVMNSPQPDPAKARKGEVSVDASVAGKQVALTMPAGWTVDAPNADGMIVLHNPAVTGTITVTLASILDSDPPQAAILKASAQTLAIYAAVQKRRETSSSFSGAGASTSTIWRHGMGANGPLTTCEAVGNTGELYWLMRYQLAADTSTAEMKAVNDLIDAMSVDPKP